jgi:putative SOS response-associated peptidase YedK
MCGRSSLAPDEATLAEHLASVGVHEKVEWRPRWNIAPTQEQLVVSVRDGARVAAATRWGLVPSWAKDVEIGNGLINCRSETITEKAAFRDAFRRRRALVVVDGFYAWRVNGDGSKSPMRVQRRDGAPFTFAGLWETRTRGGEPLTTCTIVTTTPNALVEPIHHRMPVILDDAARDAWLAPETSVDDLVDLFAPRDDDAFEAYEVSAMVNSPRNDRPECAARVA